VAGVWKGNMLWFLFMFMLVLSGEWGETLRRLNMSETDQRLCDTA
jgi:hypothetical protein